MSEQLCIFHVDLNFVNLRPGHIQRWLKIVAEMGYNAILWEVEDKVAWERCSKAVWPEAMSKAEFRALLDQAAALGLEAIPLLQTIGHGEYILKQAEYSHMREIPDRHDCYCTENPETRRFLKGLIQEYLDLFGDIRRFHIGGDEAYVFARCPECSKKAEQMGRNALYARHILDISVPIRERGVQPGIWGDMALAHPEQMDAIPRDLEIWDWNYWAHDGETEKIRVWGKGLVTKDELTEAFVGLFPEARNPDGQLNGFYTTDALRRNGYNVVLCGSARAAGDSFFCPKTSKRDGNIVAAARKATADGLLGTCVTDWAIRLNSWELHRTSLALAPAAMRQPSLSFDELRQSAGSALFRSDARPFFDAVDQVSGVSFPFSKAHSTAVQWTGMKDSLPAPPGYIAGMLKDWETSGRLEQERLAIGNTIETILEGVGRLQAFAGRAEGGLETLRLWTRAAYFQVWQARMAKEILRARPSVDAVEVLRGLRNEYEEFLRQEQTPASAAQNARLVYDALVEVMEGP